LDVIPHIGYSQAIILGLLQGLTEFLPVSSTAHMAIAPQLLFKMPDPGAPFSAVVQLGPIFAIIAYFRTDLVRYVQGIFRHHNPSKIPSDDVDAKLGWYVVFATIPIIIFGVVLQHKIETVFRSLYIIAFSLIVLAFILLWADLTGSRTTRLNDITLRESLIIGFAQVLALIPGTSRSGVTITAGLFQHLDRESAARFSFLLSIPAITAAGVFELFKVVRKHELNQDLGAYLIGAVVAGVFAYIVIRWFLGYMKEHNNSVFIIYRIVLGVVLLALLHFHIISDHHRLQSARVPQSISIRLASK
jgi:undecaprenyl-diphosphatase